MQSTSELVAEFRSEIAAIKTRLGNLEGLADRLGYPMPTVTLGATTEDAPEAEENNDTDAYDDTDRDVYGRASGVDYVGAAFGLYSLREKVAGIVRHVEAGTLNEQTLLADYTGAVDWFVACFRNDPAFDEGAFRRNAGV